MSDLISRQAAIDAINHICPVDTEYDCTLLDRVDVRYVLSDLPSAEPVQHGKWIDETFKPWGLVHHPFKCNLCGEHAEFASPYCPNCGARMDEE